jgi:hypothetical protein
MPTKPRIFCPWVTPKVFADFGDPRPGVRSFFDHYAEWIAQADQTVVNFCAGNGDHILNYRGKSGWDEAFDWARYSSYTGGDAARLKHNLDWLQRVREGGERSSNPYCMGPAFITSDQVLTYRVLDRMYTAFREEAARRRVNFRLLEYLEPGPEFCRCEWKTVRHPEGARGKADGEVIQGVIDVSSTLHADAQPYAAFPTGFPAGTNTGDFCIAQTEAFTRDFGLDGVFLGNQFGLIGFWNPKNAPPPTSERRAAIRRFFHGLRAALGSRLIYWMDTYWPVEDEVNAWGMCEENYAQLDAVLVSNFAVLTDFTRMERNLRSKLALRSRLGNQPAILYSVDFVDPWYWYRVYLDLRPMWLHQQGLYRELGPQCQGVSFFGNDTFGHWVLPGPLGETHRVIRETHQPK